MFRLKLFFASFIASLIACIAMCYYLFSSKNKKALDLYRKSSSIGFNFFFAKIEHLTLISLLIGCFVEFSSLKQLAVKSVVACFLKVVIGIFAALAVEWFFIEVAFIACGFVATRKKDFVIRSLVLAAFITISSSVSLMVFLLFLFKQCPFISVSSNLTYIIMVICLCISRAASGFYTKIADFTLDTVKKLKQPKDRGCGKEEIEHMTILDACGDIIGDLFGGIVLFTLLTVMFLSLGDIKVINVMLFVGTLTVVHAPFVIVHCFFGINKNIVFTIPAFVVAIYFKTIGNMIFVAATIGGCVLLFLFNYKFIRSYVPCFIRNFENFNVGALHLLVAAVQSMLMQFLIYTIPFIVLVSILKTADLALEDNCSFEFMRDVSMLTVGYVLLFFDAVGSIADHAVGYIDDQENIDKLEEVDNEGNVYKMLSKVIMGAFALQGIITTTLGVGVQRFFGKDHLSFQSFYGVTFSLETFVFVIGMTAFMVHFFASKVAELNVKNIVNDSLMFMYRFGIVITPTVVVSKTLGRGDALIREYGVYTALFFALMGVILISIGGLADIFKKEAEKTELTTARTHLIMLDTMGDPLKDTVGPCCLMASYLAVILLC